MLRTIHHKMMIYALHGDLLKFYDMIQSGRILNRFSNDFRELEDEFVIAYTMFFMVLSFFIFNFFVTMRNLSLYLIFIFILYFIFCIKI